jgi:hypothetical protein
MLDPLVFFAEILEDIRNGRVKNLHARAYGLKGSGGTWDTSERGYGWFPNPPANIFASLGTFIDNPFTLVTVVDIATAHFELSGERIDGNSFTVDVAVPVRRVTQLEWPPSELPTAKKLTPVEAIKICLQGGQVPGRTIIWAKFCAQVRAKGGVSENQSLRPRGWGDEMIEKRARTLLKG